MSDYEQWERDAQVLIAVGTALRGQDPARVVLPPYLREQALAAWLREDSGKPLDETEDQRRVRGRAATLGLIGLAVQRAGDSSSFTLHADTFADAVAAAEQG